MNRLKNILMVILAGIMLVSCNEFVMLEKGEGYLSVSLQRDDSVQTKAAEDPADDQVFSLNIFRGEESIETIDDHRTFERMRLVADTYRIVATSGTDASAAWDTPFYHGETSIRVLPDKENTATLTCVINNVLVSVEFDAAFKENIKEYSLVVDNGESQLTFSEAEGTLDRTAYFSVTGKLNWELTFTNADGKTFTSTQSYTDVKAQQHYKLKFSVAEKGEMEDGAAGFKIIVDDSINPEKEFVANVYFGLENYPSITTNEEFDITDVVTFPAGDETPKVFNIIAKNGISRLFVRQRADNSDMLNYSMWYDLVEATPEAVEEMKLAGITADAVAYGATEATIDITRYVSGLLMGEYVIEAVVYDIAGQKVETVANFNVQSGVDADVTSAEAGATTAIITAKWFSNPRPAGLGLEYRAVGTETWVQVNASDITFNEVDKRFSAILTGLELLTEYEFRPYSDNDKDLNTMSFTTVDTVIETVKADPWGRFAVVTGKWNEVNGEPAGLRFEYRIIGTSEWLTADQATIETDPATRLFVGEIRNLDPNASYEFRANLDGADEDKLNVVEFTTESTSTVYNLSFDDWYQSGKVWYPFAEGAQHAWDSANEGAATFIGSSTTPAEGSDAFSGKAVRMESKWAVIAFAAGNLYTGDFGKINGKGAILDWGIPFDSRPLALKGYYKYTPKTIDRTGDGMGSYDGKMDKMQIQIMITDWTAPFTVNTLDKQFVDFNADYIIAYGKLESDQAFDSYQEFTIPLEYRSLTKKPAYIVISACASYLGDYFTGGVGSTLWVDEFSLEYDPANLTEAERQKVNYR